MSAQLLCVVVFFAGFFLVTNCEEKFGCKLPQEPLFGHFDFNERRKSYRLSCDENFRLQPGGLLNLDRFCRNGKWTGPVRDCVLKYQVRKQCPQLYDPKNGKVFAASLDQGASAAFECDSGYLLVGSREVICTTSQIWSGEIPICRSNMNAADIANNMKETFIDKYAGSTSTSESGPQGRLSIGKRGLDIIIAVDTSSSIGTESLKIAKRFMEVLVKIFGVSSNKAGGQNGTRFAIVTFASTATVHLQIDDKLVRTVNSTIDKINEIQITGGGTSISSVLNTIITQIHLVKIAGSNRQGQETNRAVFLITDASQTVKANTDEMTQKIKLLKEEGYEIFTMGVGRNIDKLMLKKIASEPTEEHVFLINQFQDLKAIGDTIAEKNIDYGKCGISGNTDIAQGTDASKKGAWPWVGWLSAQSKTCGGVLLCARYFMTSARCVSDVNETGHVIPYTENMITVNLGDSRLYQGDDEQVMPVVKDVIIHPNYTGVPNEHDIRDYDVAILDFGEDNSTQPPLNKFIKPICFPYRKVYNLSEGRLESLKVMAGEAYGFTVGWGLSPDSHTRQVPWGKQKQNRREIQSDVKCGRRYPGLKTERYFCVGNIRKEGDSCRGDIGGAYMAELSNFRYSAFGLAQKTYDCQDHLQFSIFLDLHHPSITEWALPILGRCNRLGSAEDEEKEAELERENARNKTEEADLVENDADGADPVEDNEQAGVENVVDDVEKKDGGKNGNGEKNLKKKGKGKGKKKNKNKNGQKKNKRERN
ncbi:complement C2-like [Mya arenaria]|uniref:complement C2-like n=1 Tax=Mya arenaria TaxID=6604 RepID=UPI0022E14D7C|nr:complement C2-like [Mya arenaria]